MQVAVKPDFLTEPHSEKVIVEEQCCVEHLSKTETNNTPFSINNLQQLLLYILSYQHLITLLNITLDYGFLMPL